MDAFLLVEILLLLLRRRGKRRSLRRAFKRFERFAGL